MWIFEDSKSMKYDISGDRGLQRTTHRVGNQVLTLNPNGIHRSVMVWGEALNLVRKSSVRKVMV